MTTFPPGVSRHEPASTTAGAGSCLTARVLEAGRSLGFAAVGVAPVDRDGEAADALRRWLDGDFHGAMAYLAGASDRANPRALLAEARSVVVVALAYGDRTLVPIRRKGSMPTGVVARYARGLDYHVVIKAKLRELADVCATLVGRPVLARACVDTAPLLERAAARRAGVGFTAKSTMTIVPGVGSYVLLGELLLDVELEPGRSEEPKCGSCSACLDACPTGAFLGPHRLDARRCISYLTIEQSGPIPLELRALLGTRVFGCDVCQEVCPFNAGAGVEASGDLSLDAARAAPDLVELLQLSSGGYRRLVRDTALRRASRNMLARNAAVALGNAADLRAVPALTRALESHRSSIVRGHAAWALGRLGGDDARAALTRALHADTDEVVLEEARTALETLETH